MLFILLELCRILLTLSQGPKAQSPGKYIRYIYNRIILENATVRATAISTLAKYEHGMGVHVTSVIVSSLYRDGF